MICWRCCILCVIFFVCLYLYINRKISIDDAIKLLKKELKDTETIENTNKLRNNYHKNYWINVINMNILNQDSWISWYKGHSDFNVREIEERFPTSVDSKIKLRLVKSYIKKMIKEHIPATERIEWFMEENKDYFHLEKCKSKKESKISDDIDSSFETGKTVNINYQEIIDKLNEPIPCDGDEKLSLTPNLNRKKRKP